MFNLGIISATFGLVLWIAFYSGFTKNYPIQAHGNIMYFSFLMSFVMGFLMTAIPKMTRSVQTSTFEIIFALVLCSFNLFSNLIFFVNSTTYIFALQLIFLIYFILSRVLKTKKIPFAGFVFLPFAFSLAFFGIIWTLFFSAHDFKYFYILCAEAFILNLICGIGTRLVPVICRIPSALNPDQEISNPGYAKYFTYAVLLNSTYMLQFFEFNSIAYLLRVIFLIYYSIFEFKIFKKPTQWTVLGLSLQLSILSSILGYILVLYDAVWYLTGIHIVYVSGFSLLTLMIASRVSIAHSQRSINLEIKSTPIMLTAAFVIVSAIFRYLINGNSPQFGLVLAAISFLVAIWNWKFFILRK